VRVLVVEAHLDLGFDELGVTGAEAVVFGFHHHVVGLPPADLLVQLVTGADELV
jgi:hypothetical protein